MNAFQSTESNNNLTESSQSHYHQQAYVTNGSGSVRPLLSPYTTTSSDNNIGRRKRVRLTELTDNLTPPQFQPQNPEHGLFLRTQPQQNRFLQQQTRFLPQPMQQKIQPPQPSLLVKPMKQSQRSQPLLLRPMKQGQMLPAAEQQSQRRQLLLPLQQSQQSQWAQLQQQRSPIMMQRGTQRSNMGQQKLSYSNLLTEVMHYQWARPHNNSIEFWRQYVAKYYDPKAKERWCLSKCNDSRIPTRKDGESCTICGWAPERGFEVSFEELPERLKNKFDRVMGERLSPGVAEEHKSKKGVTTLLYLNATQQSIYGQERIIHKGLLRLEITDQRKILSWEFCVNDREIFVSVQRPLPSCLDSRLGLGEIFGRPEAKNVSDESSEENLQRNSQIVQDAWPRVDKNVFRIPGEMQEANSQGKRIKHTTMNDKRAIQSSPTSHDSSNQNEIIAGKNADQMSGKLVSVGANNSQQANSQGKRIKRTTMNDKRVIQSSPTSHDSSNQNEIIGGNNADQMYGKPVLIGANNSQQANSQGQRIKQTTMNDSRAIQSSQTSRDGSSQDRIIAEQNADHMSGKPVSVGVMNGSMAIQSSPTSHDGSNQYGIIAERNADQMSRKPVSVGANNSQTSGLSYDYMVRCLLRNAAANLELEISQNAMSNLHANQTGESSHNAMSNLQAKHTGDMTVGGQNANEASGNGVAGGTKTTQNAAASPVESRETGLIPGPAMEAQVQEIPGTENPASDQPQINKDTSNSQMVMDDLYMFINQLNDDNEFEMFISDGDDRTEATALANEEDIETYLIDKPE